MTFDTSIGGITDQAGGNLTIIWRWKGAYVLETV